MQYPDPQNVRRNHLSSWKLFHYIYQFLAVLGYNSLKEGLYAI